MEFIDIDFNSDKDLKEIIECMNKNSIIAKKMLEEIKKTNQKNNDFSEKITNNKEEHFSETIFQERYKGSDDDEFENEIDYYYNQIKSLKPSNNLKEEIKDILPSSKKNNYRQIILRLKLEIMKSIKETKESLSSLIEIMEKDDLEEFRDEILFEQQKIKIINDINIESESNLQPEKEFEENNLIFIPTVNGNIRVLEEIEKIDQVYLEGFKQLFNSIKDGTFKKVKNFSNNKKMNISEVRGDKVRIIFDRIGKKDYAIITVFIKKCSTDSCYYNLLEVRIKNYENQKESIKKALENSEFREENKKYEQELFDMLNNINTDSDKKQKRRGK